MNNQTKKFDNGKAPISLVDPDFITEVAHILAMGKEKYGAYNWALGTDWDRTYSALMRHMFAWWNGENTDEESGRTHLAHAACNLMFLMHWQKHGKGKDTRYKTHVPSVSNPKDLLDAMNNLPDDWKPQVSPICAGQDCDFCDEIRETCEPCKEAQLWGDTKQCDHCEKPYTAHCVDTNEKWCLDHWKEKVVAGNKALKSFCDTVGIPFNEVEECEDGEWDADGCGCKDCG